MTSGPEEKSQRPAAGSGGETPPESVGESIEEIRVQLRQQAEMTARGFKTLKGNLDQMFDRLKQVAGDVLPEQKPKQPAEKIEIPDFDAPEPSETAFPRMVEPVCEEPPAQPAQLPEVHASPPAQLSEIAIQVSETAARAEVSQVQAQPREAATDAPVPVAEERRVATSAETVLEQIVFGRDMAYSESLAADRRELIDGLVRGDSAAMTLAGQLLIFRAATGERMPQLLKDMGEAYYRWRPYRADGRDPMRDAVVAWLTSRCQAAGVGNTISLVHPGDRYESARHSAKRRGVEVSEVYGWVVLRENGKVYTKASVEVK